MCVCVCVSVCVCVRACVCVCFDSVYLWQNLSISLRLGYDVLYNGTSLIRTTGDGVTMVPHS